MQQEFQFPKGRGGRRERAGRRRGTRVSHHARPQFEKATPVHVTVRVRAIAYVLRNHEHHFGAVGRDPFSSDGLAADHRRARLAIPISWLLTVGWRRASLADQHRLQDSAFAHNEDRLGRSVEFGREYDRPPRCRR